MTRHVHMIDVEFGDCDPAGIVFYPNYYRWMDMAALRLFASVGLGWLDMEAKYGAPGLPLIAAHAEFRSPSQFGDRVQVESWVSQWGTKSLTVNHIITNAGRLAVEGWEKRIWALTDPAQPGKLLPRPIPEEVKALLPAVEG